MPVLPAPLAQAQVAGQAREVTYADPPELLDADGRRKGNLIPIGDHASRRS
ncbi:MAG: hypothetical protein ACC700_14100 [Anaerolineales bacterium]